MELKKGYKEVDGVSIPNDWNLVSLGDFMQFKNGLNKEKHYFGVGTHIVNYMDVYKKRGLKESDISGRVTLTNPEIKNYEVKKGDILFTRTSETVEEIGLSAIILEELKNTVFSGFVLRARPKDQRLELLFGKYCFSTLNARKEVISQSSYTTRALTNGRQLSKVKIALPSKKLEQLAIAKALDETESLIENLVKLIAKKDAIRKGTIIALLTGKRRLSRFNEPRFDIELKELVNILKGNGLSKSKVSDTGAFKCILYGELFTKYGQVINKVTSYTDYDEGISSKRGDIILPCSTTTTGTDLAIASAICESNILLGGDINILRRKTDCYNSEFLAYYLTYVKRIEIAEKAQGTTIIHLYGKSLATIQLNLPIVEEQNAIANIIEDIEAEILQLQLKLQKYKMIKQSMMQQLLTGKIRL